MLVDAVAAADEHAPLRVGQGLLVERTAVLPHEVVFPAQEPRGVQAVARAVLAVLDLVLPQLAADHVLALDAEPCGAEGVFGVLRVLPLQRAAAEPSVQARRLLRFEAVAREGLVDQHRAARSQDAMALAQRWRNRKAIAEHVATPDEVDAAERKRDGQDRGFPDGDALLQAGILHRLARRRQEVRHDVDADDLRWRALGEPAGRPAGAGPDVEDRAPRIEVEVGYHVAKHVRPARLQAPVEFSLELPALRGCGVAPFEGKRLEVVGIGPLRLLLLHRWRRAERWGD